jgi:hypothetical protein
MNFQGYESASEAEASLRHEFVIGPLRRHFLFEHEARQYYCIRCKWTVLISGSKVVVLDKHGSPLADSETLERFGASYVGPCPVLKALAAEAFGPTTISQLTALGRNTNEPSYMAAEHVLAGTRGLGPLLRIFARLRGDLRRMA